MNTLLDVGIDRVIDQTLQLRGVDLREYKSNFLRRRMEVRLRARGINSYLEYATLLKKDVSEYSALFEALSINVTEFFRDKDVFDAFATDIIPYMLQNTNLDEIRVWSAGCATGEEAYTLAIILRETLPHSKDKFRVIGTDVNAKAVESARRGEYSSSTLKHVPPQLLSRHFDSVADGTYRVTKETKDSVTFHVGDLAIHPPPRDLDAIFCRNVLIYFERQAQNTLFAKFHNALKESGYLVLGKAETIIGQPSSYFELVMPRQRICRKR